MPEHGDGRRKDEPRAGGGCAQMVDHVERRIDIDPTRGLWVCLGRAAQLCGKMDHRRCPLQHAGQQVGVGKTALERLDACGEGIGRQGHIDRAQGLHARRLPQDLAAQKAARADDDQRHIAPGAMEGS
ncbi:MAG: hypothetical protein R3D60_12595 [Paracoccaceae bacterium]